MGHDAGRRELVDHWLESLRDPRVESGLEKVYAQATEAIRERGPACWASGRCCNFKAAGHRLYVTGLEAAYCLVRVVRTEWAAAAQRIRGDAEGHDLSPSLSLPVLGRPPMPTGRGLIADIDAARVRGGCPFQVANLCGVHEIKPLGCRVYFCDRSAETWQQDLSERLLGEIRAIHDRHGVEYRYGEWLEMLRMFRA